MKDIYDLCKDKKILRCYLHHGRCGGRVEADVPLPFYLFIGALKLSDLSLSLALKLCVQPFPLHLLTADFVEYPW